MRRFAWTLSVFLSVGACDKKAPTAPPTTPGPVVPAGPDYSKWEPAKGIGDHGKTAHTVAVDPAGKVAASAAHSGGSIKVWDLAAGKELKTLDKHTDSVVSLAFSQDGKRLMSASLDKTLRTWDTGSWIQIVEYAWEAPTAGRPRMSPDGRWVAFGSKSGEITCLGVEGGGMPLFFQGHTKEVWVVAFSGDGKLLASGDVDSTVRIWDMSGKGGDKSFETKAGPIRAIAFSPDGKFVATASDDKSVRLFDTSGKQLWDTKPGELQPMQVLRFSPDGKVLAGGAGYTTIWLWDPQTGKEIGGPRLAGNGASDLDFSADGRKLVTVEGNRVVLFFRPR